MSNFVGFLKLLANEFIVSVSSFSRTINKKKNFSHVHERAAPLMVTPYVQLPSQLLKSNSGAALRAVTNDECPVRIN